MAEKKVIQEYVDLRVLATLLVLIGHATKIFMTMKTGIYPTFEFNTDIFNILENIRLIIYSFHMPMFIMLSGAVFTISFRERDKNKWIINRFKRLIIPGLATCIFLLLPVRLFVGYYRNTTDLFINIIWKDYLLGFDINYLWFVLVLIQINLLMIPLSKFLFNKNVYNKFIMMSGLLIISIIQFKLPALPFQINSVLRYLFWFYLGACFEQYRNNINKKLTLKYVVILFFIWILSYQGHVYLEKLLLSNTLINGVSIIKLIKMGIRYVMEFSGSAMSYAIVFLMKFNCNKFKNIINVKSFAIYLYHCPILYLIQHIYAIVFADTYIGVPLYIILTLFQIVLALFLSLVLDKYIHYIKCLLKKQRV